MEIYNKCSPEGQKEIMDIEMKLAYLHYQMENDNMLDGDIE